MEIVPNLQRDKMSKEQIEYLQKQEQQYKYIGSLKNIPGLTLFSFNRVTKVVKVADITKQISVNLKGKPVDTKKLVQEEDCFYDFALNTKNFIKHLIRYGLIEKKEDVIVAKKTNM